MKPHDAGEAHQTRELLRQVDQIVDEFEKLLRAGQQPQIEMYLTRIGTQGRILLLEELLSLEIEWNSEQGLTVVPDGYLRRFPQYSESVQKVISNLSMNRGASAATPPSWYVRRRAAILPGKDAPVEVPSQTQQPASPASLAEEALPRPFGKFLLKQKLGTGGFGTVYLAEDQQLGRQVALKIPHRIDDPDLRRRFITEARAAAKLDHSGIVKVFESELVGDQLYVATVFVDGSDLGRNIKDHRPSLKKLVTWLRDASHALAYAHREGVIHRDVKPSNMLINQAGQIFISDFGLARRLDDNSSLTSTGNILGTPRYMAPEQAAGLNSVVGPASDQYSVAVMLYEMLTGRPPFTDKMPKLLQQIINEQPPSPREVHAKTPVDLETICLKGLAKNPAHRYPDLDAFAADLNRWLNGQPIEAQRLPPPTGLKSWLRHRMTLMFGTAAALVAIVASIAWILMNNFGPPSAATQLAKEQNVKLFQPDKKKPVPSPPGEPEDLQAMNLFGAKLPSPPLTLSEEQLAEQRSKLLTLLTPGATWKLPTRANNGQESEGALTVLEQSDDGGQVLFLLSESKPSIRRSVWAGSVVKQPYPGRGSVWIAAMKCQMGDLRPANGSNQELSVSVDSQAKLIWVRQPQPMPLERVAAPSPVPAMKDLIAPLVKATQRRQVWEGTLQYPAATSKRVRLTFTEHANEGQYIAAILEDVENPFASASFVGILNPKLANLYAGHPISLERRSTGLGIGGREPVFSAPNEQRSMQLSLSEDSLVGQIDRADIRLSPQPPLRNYLKSGLPCAESMSPSIPQQGAGELNEAEMIEPVLVVADEECAALRQPPQRAFDHPATRF